MEWKLEKKGNWFPVTCEIQVGSVIGESNRTRQTNSGHWKKARGWGNIVMAKCEISK